MSRSHQFDFGDEVIILTFVTKPSFWLSWFRNGICHTRMPRVTQWCSNQTYPFIAKRLFFSSRRCIRYFGGMVPPSMTSLRQVIMEGAFHSVALVVIITPTHSSEPFSSLRCHSLLTSMNDPTPLWHRVRNSCTLACSISDEFYSLFYLGLYCEIRNEASKAETYMKAAASSDYATGQGTGDYMTSCARVHCKLRGWETWIHYEDKRGIVFYFRKKTRETFQSCSLRFICETGTLILVICCCVCSEIQRVVVPWAGWVRITALRYHSQQLFFMKSSISFFW